MFRYNITLGFNTVARDIAIAALNMPKDKLPNALAALKQENRPLFDHVIYKMDNILAQCNQAA